MKFKTKEKERQEWEGNTIRRSNIIRKEGIKEGNREREKDERGKEPGSKSVTRSRKWKERNNRREK